MPVRNTKKSKFTASVNERIVEMVDKRAAKLNVSRSDIVEQAMELWLRQQAELDEEQYFSAAADEMNADAKLWNQLTSRQLQNQSES